MYRTIAKKPRVSCRSNLRRVLDHELKTITANPNIQTYDVESSSARKFLDLLFESDKTNYTSIEQRIAWSISECGLYYDHLQKLNMRIQVSKHKFLKIPSEPAMRFACQHCRSDVLVSQLTAGYSVNSFIHEFKTGGSLTTPLIAAMAFPNVARILLANGANIDKTGGDGVTPIEHAVEALRRAQKLPVTEQNWKTDQQKQYLPSFIYTLLAKGCIRSKKPEIRDSRVMKKMTKLLVRTRWTRVRRLAKAVGIASQVLSNHLLHVRFAPGGEVQKRIKRNFDECCAAQKGVSEGYEVNPTTDYF